MSIDSYTEHMTGSAVVAAVHEDETTAFLRRVGLYEAFVQGELVCSVCGQALVDAGLGAARGHGGEIIFVCTKLDCQDEFHRA